jgi:signal transduction histidine kinase
LAIVKEICEAHGWQITAQVNEGAGLIFTVVFKEAA